MQTPDTAPSGETRSDHAGSRLRERGQGLVEYAFILVLVAVLLILAVETLGHQTNSLYSNISNGFKGH